MIVPDASALALIFADEDAEPRTIRARELLDADPAWVVPEHWRTEVFNVIRGLWLGRKFDDAQAVRAAGTLARMVVAIAPTAPLLDRMWQLRSNLSGYDAAYVAAAEDHDATLVTADLRLAKTGLARCPIQVIN
ncbi:type II toxin-antitoxin system VapC family toxin [Microlunatus parietis]|uniref:Ribonuclease VapC n=1 Tax=Microlunatus parietis TaxID=682979 RepID=A0A7Y9L6T0_9ACTN|nr:type II toxin-antitoxin system VapC family toxin [Microlunatus parietis]NYE69119.1 putative nucleic acid-binding protein [Microlunatus parietis]